MTTGTIETVHHIKHVEAVPEEVLVLLQWHAQQCQLAIDRAIANPLGQSEHLYRANSHARRFAIISAHMRGHDDTLLPEAI